jgi:mono/diheme cytochrome c family protein
MAVGKKIGWRYAAGMALLVFPMLALHTPDALAQQAAASSEVTFTKDIAPILQRSCQTCHRPDGVAPMALISYEDVRPWARSIKTKTGIGPKAGVMPPWYIEKNIGIQHYKDDPSLSDEEIARIAKWADTGAPRGNPADMPPPRSFASRDTWNIGPPDIIVSTKDVFVKANAPDWWGEIESVPVNIPDDRYVAAVQIREVNDIPKDGSGRTTVGGHYVFHHMIWSTRVQGPDGQVDTTPDIGIDQDNSTSWPVHEVGRNPDFFDPRGARLLRANSWAVSNSVHLHSNGRDTKAHLEIGFKLQPKGYKPEVKRSLSRGLGNGVDIDIKSMEANQQLHAYTVLQEHTKIITFEPHLHAPGMRMCLETIWGFNIQTLSCSGYDHNWVRGYAFQDDYAPLLPKGTILHIIGYMDNSPSNKNIPDPRNWQGSGNRSIANMFIDLGMGVSLTDEQFQQEMADRRAKLNLTKNDVVIGCPLCLVTPPKTPQANTGGQQP